MVGGGHARPGDRTAGDGAQSADAQIAGKLAGSAGAASIKEAVFPHFAPETVRFFLLSTHYRSPIDFSLERIGEVDRGLGAFYRLFDSFEKATGRSFYDLAAPARRDQTTQLEGDPAFVAALSDLRQRFWDAMDDDFNTGGAVGVLFELRKTIASFITQHGLDKGQSSDAAALSALTSALTSAVTLLKELANTLGVFRSPVEKPATKADDEFAGRLMDLLIQLRAEARQNKNYALSDRIRDGLGELSIIIKDSPQGTTWERQ
jgi:cysteinyl-tRNA synthetase